MEDKIESKPLVEEKKVVVPGEVLATGIEFLPGKGAHKENGEVRSKILGLVKFKNHLVSVIPLAGVYIPVPNDRIIGEVKDVQITSWFVDINSPYMGFLSLSEGVEEFVDLSKKDITEYFDVGDVIYAKIQKVTKKKDVQLTMKDSMCRKLHDGNIIRINPAKVPRVIGKSGSMIEMIKNKTGSHIIVGQNGLVWLNGGKESLATKAILTIENESHKEGLTDRIAEMLDKELKGDNNE